MARDSRSIATRDPLSGRADADFVTSIPASKQVALEERRANDRLRLRKCPLVKGLLPKMLGPRQGGQAGERAKDEGPAGRSGG